MKNKITLKLIVFILLTAFNLQSQTVFNVSGNTATLNTHRNGWKMDSILVVPVRGHSVSNTATPLIGRIQVNSATQLPEYNNGSGWNYFVTENSGFTYSKSQSDARFKPISYVPAYADITGKPDLTAYYLASNPNGYISSVPAQTWSSITGKPSFSTVATSGSYLDLANRPVIPTNNNQLSNGSGYLTTEVDGSITNELQTLSVSGNNLTISSGNTVAIPQNNYTAGTGISISSNVISNILPDQTVIINGTTGTYPNFTIPQPVISIATRTLNTNFTPSATRNTLVSYSVTCQVTNPLLVGTSTATAFLEYSINGGTTWLNPSQVANSSGVGLTVTVQLTNAQTGTLVGVIPANALARIRTATTGTGTVTYVTGTEINL